MRTIIGTVMIFASAWTLTGVIGPENFVSGVLCMLGIMIGTVLQVVR